MEVVLKLFQEGTLFFWWMCYALTTWDFEGNAIVLGYWSNDARKKERKKVKDVLSKYPDMPLPPPPLSFFFSFLPSVSALCFCGIGPFRSSRVYLSRRTSTSMVLCQCPFVYKEVGCHSVSQGFIFQIYERENDGQMSHSVMSYWFNAGLWDRASNCQFHTHAK